MTSLDNYGRSDIEKGMEPHVALLHFDTPWQFWANATRRETLVGFTDGAYGDPTLGQGGHEALRGSGAGVVHAQRAAATLRPRPGR